MDPSARPRPPAETPAPGEMADAPAAGDLMALRKLSGPVLSGLLRYFSPSAVLSLLNMQKATGVLYLQNRSLAATIHLDNGEVVAATLGADRGVSALFYALSWNTGRFQFRLEPPGPRSIHLSLPVIQVRATLWLDRWRSLQAVFPTIWYRVGIHPQPSGEVVIQPHQWQALTRIVAEPVSLVRLAEMLKIDVLAVTRVAAELVRLGLAVVVPPDEAESGGEDTFLDPFSG